MRHNNTTILAISRTPNPTKFPEDLRVERFLFRRRRLEFPVRPHPDGGQVGWRSDSREGLPEFLQWFPTSRSTGLQSIRSIFGSPRKTCRFPKTGFFYDGDRVNLDLTPTNLEAHRRLKQKLRDLSSKLDVHPHLFERSLYLGKDVPIEVRPTRPVRYGPGPIRNNPSSILTARRMD